MKKIIAAVALIATVSSAFASAGFLPLSGPAQTTTCNTYFGNQVTCTTR